MCSCHFPNFHESFNMFFKFHQPVRVTIILTVLFSRLKNLRTASVSDLQKGKKENSSILWFLRVQTFNTWIVSAIPYTLGGELEWSHDMLKFHRGREVNQSLNHSFDLHLTGYRYVVLSFPAVLLFTNACRLSSSSLSQMCDETPNWISDVYKFQINFLTDWQKCIITV